MKGSVDTTTLQPMGMNFYAGVCAWALARAHARTGDAAAIAAYLGTSDTFDGAIADFAETYADVNQRDHEAYLAAIKDGRVSTMTSDEVSMPAVVKTEAANLVAATKANAKAQDKAKPAKSTKGSPKSAPSAKAKGSPKK